MYVPNLRRLLAFSFLTSVWLNAAVYAGNDLPVDEPSTKPTDFPEPSTLKDILDLLGKLGSFGKNSKVPEKVAETIDRKTHEWVEGSRFWQQGIDKNLKKLFKKITKLRAILLKDPTKYGQYSEIELSMESVDYYADLMAYWLPILHSELWFLTFHTGLQCVHIGGSSWKTHPFGKSRYPFQLQQWLTDTLTKKNTPYISKGFSPDELHERNVGFHVDFYTGISLFGAPLNHAQYGLFLISPIWHESNLASAVLFLQEFCREVEGKKFDKYMKDEKYDVLKTACEVVYTDISSLTEQLSPLYGDSSLVYKGKLKAEQYPKYHKFLHGIMGPIKASLHQMSGDSNNWTGRILYNAESAGPFKYGFVFKNSEWEVDSFQPELTAVIERLTDVEHGSLTKLSRGLEMLPAPSQEL